MKLDTLYHFFQRKYQTNTDRELRKRLLALPEVQIAHLVDRTLVLENQLNGLKVLKHHHICGLTFTTAIDTVAVPNKDKPLTVENYFRERGAKLEHPGLPLLAVNVDPRSKNPLRYEYIPLERVFYREIPNPAKFKVGADTSSDSDYGELLRDFTDKFTASLKKPQATKEESPIRLEFRTIRVEDQEESVEPVKPPRFGTAATAAPGFEAKHAPLTRK